MRRSSWLRLRGEVGKRAGQFAEVCFGGGERRFGRGRRARRRRCAARRCRCASCLSALLLGGEPLQRGFGVGCQRALALDVLGQLNQPPFEFGDALLGAGLLLVERFARDDQALQRGAGAGLRLAQRRHRGGGFACALAGLGLRDGARRRRRAR